MKTRRATLSDLDRMLEIEESAIPNYGYLDENKEFYFDGVQNQGEMILACKDELPVGMGQYSILPDGSGWLEILRVHQDFQRQGAGNAIYKRYMELAEMTNAPSVAMFTGRRNIASKTLAEKYGFEIAASHKEYALALKDIHAPMDDSFHLVNDPLETKKLLESSWGTFMGLNRTYFHMNDSLVDYLSEKKMVYSDGVNTVVLGCRMLKHRGWYIGCMKGDFSKCIQFAIARTKQEQLPKLTISLPSERTDLISALEQSGFSFLGELIVMELNRKEKKHV